MNTTSIKSKAIEAAVRIALDGGNEIGEVTEGWTKVKQVIQMRRPLTAATRSAIVAMATLRYWSTEPTPHNAAEEGFTDDVEKVGLSFPRTGS